MHSLTRSDRNCHKTRFSISSGFNANLTFSYRVGNFCLSRYKIVRTAIHKKLFLRYKVLSKIEGMVPDPRVIPGDIKVVSFNPSHHEEYEYIW